MPVARVVSFEGVSKDRMEEMRREMREGEPPEGFPATEVLVLHDPEAEKSLVVLFFRVRGRLQARRRRAKGDAGRRHSGAPHFGDEVRSRGSYDALTRSESPDTRETTQVSERSEGFVDHVEETLAGVLDDARANHIASTLVQGMRRADQGGGGP